MVKGADIEIHLVLQEDEWKKLLVILEDCAPVAYYSKMATSLIQQGADQAKEKNAIIPQ